MATPTVFRANWLWICGALLGVAGIFATGCNAMPSDPEMDDSSTSRKLAALPRRSGPRKVVTIYEFRSSVLEIDPNSATDMFITALVKSGAFAVAERSRLNEGVLQEKRLNAGGLSTGAAAAGQLAGASYIFEGSVSGVGQGFSQDSGGLNIGGMQIGGGSGGGNIDVDVRILDANSGLVLDSINVSKSIASYQAGVSGIGHLMNTNANVNGRDMIDGNAQVARKESVNKAFRASAEAAVLELAKRFGGE
jgi:curli biogenesis system outer membrane secretion channel CsgG